MARSRSHETTSRSSRSAATPSPRPDQAGTAERDRGERRGRWPAVCRPRSRPGGGSSSCTATARRSATWRIQQDEAQRTRAGAAAAPALRDDPGQLGSVLVRAIDRLCGAGTAVAVVTARRRSTRPIRRSRTRPSRSGRSSAPQRAARARPRRGWQVVEDAGRGYRRVVASPRPIGMVEMRGDPHAARRRARRARRGRRRGRRGRAADGALDGVDAVIDKDLAAAALADGDRRRASCYLLTGVDAVLLDYGTPRERPVAPALRADEAERHLAAGQFPPGAWVPKIAAALALPARRGRPGRHHLRGPRWRTAARASRVPGPRIEPVAGCRWRALDVTARACGVHRGHLPGLAAADVGDGHDGRAARAWSGPAR